MRLVVFGAGYVGLVTGTGLSDLGHDVLVFDIDPAKIAMLEDGRCPIYEPGLADLMHRNQRGGRLSFASAIPASFDEADAYFIAVGTPPGPDGAADLSAVMAVADTIARVARRQAVVVVKSTVPVGTCDAVQARLASAHVPLEVVSNPEFLKEGDALSDFFKPDRVVVGARSEEARQMIRDLYAPLQLSGERLVITDPRSSELIKYASNTMLAIRISFMNELSRLCHATGADIHSVRLGVGTDSRIGRKFLYAGPGYGGSCFPKDVQALSALGRAHGVQMRVAEAAHLANDEQATFLAQLVDKALEGVMGKQIALWGCAFKPETDDIRESPAVRLATALLERGATVVAHDPEAGPNFAKHFGNRLTVKERDYDALEGSHALVLLTEWRSYRAPNFAEIKRRLLPSGTGLAPVLVDARNIWRPAEVLRAGLRYQGIGVASSRPVDRPSQR
ncbi:MAG: UDP-glucose dehydrogenase [Labilithrix sp.]|nr:UDP-glucose dehydrogenase [Labilithrix sp.]